MALVTDTTSRHAEVERKMVDLIKGVLKRRTG